MGVKTPNEPLKNLENKGDIRRYEIRYRRIAQCGQEHFV